MHRQRVRTLTHKKNIRVSAAARATTPPVPCTMGMHAITNEQTHNYRNPHKNIRNPRTLACCTYGSHLYAARSIRPHQSPHKNARPNMLQNPRRAQPQNTRKKKITPKTMPTSVPFCLKRRAKRKRSRQATCHPYYYIILQPKARGTQDT